MKGVVFMKRIILLLAVTVLFVLALAVPAFADAGGVPNEGNKEAAQFCHFLGKVADFPPGWCTSQAAKF
jgi:hypothetical protein